MRKKESFQPIFCVFLVPKNRSCERNEEEKKYILQSVDKIYKKQIINVKILKR